MSDPSAIDPSPRPPRAPDVIVDFVFDDGMFHLVVENIGDAPAVDVGVAFDPPFRGLGGQQPVTSLPLFTRLPFLAPRRRISTFLDTSAAYFAREEPTKIAVTVTYADRSGAVHRAVIHHDLDIYRDLISCSRPASGV